MTLVDQPALMVLCRILDTRMTPASFAMLIKDYSFEDWEKLLVLAKEEQLAPLLYTRLLVIDPGNRVPEPVSEALHETLLQATARNMRIMHYTGQILKTLTSSGIEVIALKGLYLAEAVYPSIGLRKFGDLDLLVHKQELGSVLNIMQSMGYVLSTYYDLADDNRDIKHIPPMNHPGWPTVEVHWTILEEDSPFRIYVDDLWKRSQPARIADVDISALSLEDLLLHLCIHHTYQHRLQAGLRSLYDIAFIMQKYAAQINWQKLEETASSWGAARVIALTLALANDLFGVPVPPQAAGSVHSEVLAAARQQVLQPPEVEGRITPDLAKIPEAHGFLSKIRLVVSRVFLPKRVLARLYNADPRSLKIYLCYWFRLRDLYKVHGLVAAKLWSGQGSALGLAEQEQSNKQLLQWMVEG